jgi:tRNA-specific 2-thiouridylase
MRTPEGKRVGEHIGLAFYTIGQRKGIGLGGAKDGGGEPWYVAGKDMAANELIVVQGHEHPLLLKSRLTAADLSWVAGDAPDEAPDYAAKTRYRQADSACRVSAPSTGACVMDFAAPQWAVTPGQSAVLYRGDICLGGGIIQ